MSMKKKRKWWIYRVYCILIKFILSSRFKEQFVGAIGESSLISLPTNINGMMVGVIKNK